MLFSIYFDYAVILFKNVEILLSSAYFIATNLREKYSKNS